jgi:hypothetical protein
MIGQPGRISIRPYGTGPRTIPLDFHHFGINEYTLLRQTFGIFGYPKTEA